MGRALARSAALAAAMAACCSNLVPHAEAFVPALHSTASSMSAFHGSGAAAAAAAAAATTHTRSRRPVSSSSLIMKVAGAQPQQRDAWLEGGVKTRELFNALSQGEIGKRAFTQALAKRMMSKATGMQQDYELSEAASLAASSSASVASTADLRCGRGLRSCGSDGLVDFLRPFPTQKVKMYIRRAACLGLSCINVAVTAAAPCLRGTADASVLSNVCSVRQALPSLVCCPEQKTVGIFT